jgi:hypothetical protein
MATNIFTNIDILSDHPLFGLGIEYQCESLTNVPTPRISKFSFLFICFFLFYIITQFLLFEFVEDT